MPEKVRAFVGILTTVVFLSIGAMLLGEGEKGWGSVLLALGAFRGAWAARQIVQIVNGPDELPPPRPAQDPRDEREGSR
jgi:hypothetical protein